MHPPVYLAFTTCPNRDDAERLGRRLVDERLAACATALPGAVSFYRWKEELERNEEVLLLLKTTGPALAGLEERLIELHPYESPEFIAVLAEAVSETYGAWVAESVEAPIQPA
jgi:periplasmic divalent cation tolerance protein